MDAAQTVLLVVVVVLTILLIVLGVQVFFILREVKKTVSKANKVLDDTSLITESVSRPLSSMSTLSNGLKLGTFVAKLLKGKSSRKNSTDEEDDGE